MPSESRGTRFPVELHVHFVQRNAQHRAVDQTRPIVFYEVASCLFAAIFLRAESGASIFRRPLSRGGSDVCGHFYPGPLDEELREIPAGPHRLPPISTGVVEEKAVGGTGRIGK